MQLRDSAPNPQVYRCAACSTHLTDEANKVWRPHSFRAFYGNGALFSDVANIAVSAPTERNMTTGPHTIRDISCATCRQVIGWLYVKAPTDEEKYKEGKYLLELQLMREDSEEAQDQPGS